ncbi:unnamed protein product [Rhizopus stolonifer]
MQQAKYAKHNAKANKRLMKGGFTSAFKLNNNGSLSIASLQTISYDNSKETLGLKQDRHPMVGETKKQAKKTKNQDNVGSRRGERTGCSTFIRNIYQGRPSFKYKQG